MVVLLKNMMPGIGLNIIQIFLTYVIQINIMLGIFNLIPIPPLDGSRIIYTFADSKVREFLDSIENYGIIIILVLMSVGVLDKILYPLSSLIISGLEKIMNYTALII